MANDPIEETLEWMYAKQGKFFGMVCIGIFPDGSHVMMNGARTEDGLLPHHMMISVLEGTKAVCLHNSLHNSPSKHPDDIL